MPPLLLVLVLAAIAAQSSQPAQAAAGHPLVTGMMEPGAVTEGLTDYDAANRQLVAAGARASRIPIFWAAVAPRRPSDPSNPADSGYRWATVDARIASAVRNGLEPLVYLQTSPGWATIGGDPLVQRPDMAALVQFAEVAARRFSGDFPGLPRVRQWQVWNEPNLRYFLDPTGGDAVNRYRDMVNAVGDAVKRVKPDNLVVAGALGPYGGAGAPGADTGQHGRRPLPFMRDLLCVTAHKRPRAACRESIRFDVWAHHPYTSGRPSRKALHPGDASIGDLPAMRRILQAGVRLGNVQSSGPVQFWATEFSWDTSPHDPAGVPMRLHARWVAEAFHLMWRAGISRVFWFQLRDNALSNTSKGIWQSGVYAFDGRPKPALDAFRFPFVAYPAGRRGRNVSVWGRTPLSDRRAVIVEQRFKSRWRRLARLRSDRNGIFRARVPGRGGGAVRARAGGAAALPFGLKPPANDGMTLHPFGTGAVPEG
jgi:hypothetical protein